MKNTLRKIENDKIMLKIVVNTSASRCVGVLSPKVYFFIRLFRVLYLFQNCCVSVAGGSGSAAVDAPAPVVGMVGVTAFS